MLEHHRYTIRMPNSLMDSVQSYLKNENYNSLGISSSAELVTYSVRKLLDEGKSDKNNSVEYIRTRLSVMEVMISEMYEDSIINRDTFNRFDEFLHDWSDESNNIMKRGVYE